MAYNPYEDKSLHLTVPTDPITELHDREAFNDVIRHGDIVTGFRISRSLQHLPAWLGRPLRFLILAYVIVFLSLVIKDTAALLLPFLP
ncbi:hypothetical protein [Paenibacillus herberti]|uniref:Uncharacterized protein n=1 Tax=Paenibacillus herberti TaxID=1619309 RepID=A0A229NU46_9BACL|nr:hypothetical protein [Paenibacillus herberti]OXM13382.1 hypothetical protein CGZ75_20175 [Paenibacillus herberti]